MKTTFLVLVIGSSLSFPATAATSYTVDPKHTFPSFEISHLGFSIQRGRFDRTSGKVTLDSDKGTGSINIAVETASINTGLAELEKHLRGQDFLDAARYPRITFISDKLTFNKNQLIAADGIMTLHGVSKPVHLAIDHFYCGMNLIAMKNTCGANASATIKRSDLALTNMFRKWAMMSRLIFKLKRPKIDKSTSMLS
jgi:polyisoprenoid-binding protein YceI